MVRDVLDLNGYRDEGCEAAPSCLHCPYERCLEEVPRGRRRLAETRRDARAAELRRRGLGTREIARVLGVSQRTVQRSLSRAGRRGDNVS